MCFQHTLDYFDYLFNSHTTHTVECFCVCHTACMFVWFCLLASSSHSSLPLNLISHYSSVMFGNLTSSFLNYTQSLCDMSYFSASTRECENVLNVLVFKTYHFFFRMENIKFFNCRKIYFQI